MIKNVWIFNHYAEPPQYETRVRNNVMAKYLMRAGYDVTIFGASTIHNTDINLITDGSPYIRREYDGLKFVHINVPGYSGNGLSRKLNLLAFPYRLWKYTKRLGEKPDVIVNDLDVMAMDFPFLIAKRYHVPIITEVRDLWPESIIALGYLKGNSLLAKFLYHVEKRMYQKSTHIVFSMPGGYDYLTEKGWDTLIPREKVSYINNGVDLETFRSNKEQYHVQDPDLDDPNTFKVIYAGSIRPANGLDQVVDCAEKLKDVGNIRFLIYGEGPHTETLRQRCREKGIDNLIFKGSVGKQYIPDILSKSNLNILNYAPDTAAVFRFGSSQNKLFDYMASGKPILSNVKINYNLIDEYQCGITGDFSTGEQYAGAIKEIYHLPAGEYERLCENARRGAQDYDYQNLTQKLMVLIEHCAD